MITVNRLESMSPRGFLRLIIQDDGDVVVTCQQQMENCSVADDDRAPRGFRSATVEFCTISGGGGSKNTFRALRALAVAMAEDNADEFQQGRAGEWSGAELLPKETP